ncbi:HET-domain-containing protein, partial [Stipitochalara longipes BDJ]
MIKCTIKHGKLSEKVSYEALSYMWGSELKMQTILINAVEFPVRENLWLALQHLRWTSETRVLWIDALCIHQQNVHERNHQVSQMGRIYNRARRVIVWLGPSDTASKIFFGLLSSGKTTYVELLKEVKVALERNMGIPIPEIYSVLSRPYWKRLWIIQEVLLARELIIQCGNHSCNSSLLSWFLGHKISVRNAIRSSKAARLMGQREPLNLKLQPQRNSARGPLLRIFALNKDAECEKWLDKVFGLASLAIACCREAVTVDYSSTWSDILGKVILHHLCAHDKNQDDDFHNLSQSLWPAPAGGDYVTKNYRHLYQEMKEASQYFKDPRLDLSGTLSNFREGFLNLPYERILVAGYLRGRITYLSPRLSTDFDTLSHSL